MHTKHTQGNKIESNYLIRFKSDYHHHTYFIIHNCKFMMTNVHSKH